MRHTCCSVEGCTSKGQSEKGIEYFKKGLCNKHYLRLYRHGDCEILKCKRTNAFKRREHSLYRIYANMKDRIFRQTHKSFADYGGRGIKICERWLGIDGFDNFCSDMGTRPSPKHTLDRIDNDGDYCPENCKWSTRGEQSMNRRGTTEHPGVSFIPKSGRWRARIKVDRKSIHLGCYDVKESAIAARLSAEEKYKIHD
jgi:hypothetical protein